MKHLVDGISSLRLLMILILALTLAVGGLVPATSGGMSSVAAFDDDEDEDDDSDDLGDDDDDDDNNGNGNDDDGDDDDNPGRGNGRGKKDDDDEDDEDAFATAIPTVTPARSAITPIPSPTRTAAPRAATGTLLIRLRVCPIGTDPSVGTDALRAACPDGQPDADFELMGRAGLFDGWRRDVTTGDGGDARVRQLAPGSYNLTLDELDWCAAEASSVDGGLIVIEPDETTEVTAYLCGLNLDSTPRSGS